MKTYFIPGIFAALSIILTAFTVRPFNKTLYYVFQYNGILNENSVETESNWTFVISTQTPVLCEDIDERPCRIAVSENYIVDQSAHVPILKASTNIQAVQNQNTVYVVAIDGVENFFSNRACQY